ncbi:MAG: type II toxin-antitoxin system VapC family toxin [Bacteroidetes bacterium]|nr:type II toxin-antitoxin system VapC family toxin [Bacteroidota bacterium]
MKEYLLDTHAFLWFINADPQLSINALDAISVSENICYLSIASLWEISIKLNLGKLQLKFPLADLKQQLDLNNIILLPIEFEDTTILSSLALHHRDPFDRMIIAQSVNSNLTIITRDSHFSDYPIKTLW